MRSPTSCSARKSRSTWSTPQTGEIIIPANRKITKTLLRKLATVYDHIEIDPSPDSQQDPRNHRVSSSTSSPNSSSSGNARWISVESGDDIDPGIIKQVKVFIASKRKLSRRRQDGRPPRQQGRRRHDRAGRRHAVPRGRHAGRHRAQPARRAEPHERRSGARDAPRRRGQGARLQGRDPGLRRHHGRRRSAST